MTEAPDDLLPPGEYFVVRTTLSTGRVVVMYIPDVPSDQESREIAKELRSMAQEVSATSSSPERSKLEVN